MVMMMVMFFRVMTKLLLAWWWRKAVQANNNRLANYIDKVRQLQTENRRMTKQIQVKTIINRSSESSLNNLLEQAGENWETVEAYDSTQQYRQIVHHLYFHCFFL